MSGVRETQKVVVVGAGPVGCLAALYSARRGDHVEVYELRDDPRIAGATLSASGAIGLVLSDRGLQSIEALNNPKLLDVVRANTAPMFGRMIHRRDQSGTCWEKATSYDPLNGRFTNATDRSQLNRVLLDSLEEVSNIRVHFGHRLAQAEFEANRACFRTRQSQEVTVSFDLLIGADGAHSATRSQLMKHVPINYQQIYENIYWCELQMTDENKQRELSRDHLHIWPGPDDSMFVALPAPGGLFTSTFFAPASHYSTILDSTRTMEYFAQFPGVSPGLIDPDLLRKQLQANQRRPLMGIKCSAYHFGSNAVIVGDAAHAVLPFYGQGLNAGLEDVRVLFDHIDKYTMHGVFDLGRARATALSEYSQKRVPDGHAIHDLSRANYKELHSGAQSPFRRARKSAEYTICKYLPALGWATEYTRVSFSTESYSDIIQASDHQGRVLFWWLVVVVCIFTLGLNYWLLG